jgi:hypothetical protein
MNNEGIGKARISIDAIGAQRFWSGLIVGFLACVSLGLFFAFSRESLRFTTASTTDLLILSDSDHWFWNYFFAGLSVTLGLSISIWTWLSNRNHRRSRDKRYKSFARTMIMMNFWFVILAISRVGSLLPIMPQGLRGYDNHLDLSGDFGALFIAIPIFIFLLNWSSVRLVYQSLRWIGYSALVCAGLTIGVAHAVNVDQEPLNTVSSYEFGEFNKLIDDELTLARDTYGTEIGDETIVILKKRYTESSDEQLYLLKADFGSETLISIESIILERLSISTLKGIEWYRKPLQSIEEWQFAAPIDVYKQLMKRDVSEPEFKELAKVLQEQINLWNLESERIDEDVPHTTFEWLRLAESRVPREAYEQLLSIQENAELNNEFEKLGVALPELVRPKH